MCELQQSSFNRSASLEHGDYVWMLATLNVHTSRAEFDGPGRVESTWPVTVDMIACWLSPRWISEWNGKCSHFKVKL